MRHCVDESRPSLTACNVVQLDAVAEHTSHLSVILLFVVFVGLCDGIAQGAVFGDVAQLPPKYTQVSFPIPMKHITSLQ